MGIDELLTTLTNEQLEQIKQFILELLKNE